jgi:type II secretory pathway pseudopilin PulG
LIELLIVVSIILIIAAIAIPNLLRSRMAANESSAVATIRTVNTAEVTYAITYPAQGFAATIQALGGPAPCTAATVTASCLLDDVLSSATAQKSGYSFTAVGTGSLPMSAYTTTAVPSVIGASGQRGFFSDQTGVIRYTADGSVPTNSSPAL